MAAESKMQMTFDANAEGVTRAYDQMTVSNDRFGRAVLEGMKNAAAAMKLVSDQLIEQESATRKLTEENDRLIAKLEQLIKKDEEVVAGFKNAADGFKAFSSLIAGSQIVSFIREIIKAQSELNKEIAKTEVEIGQVINRFQTMALMSNKDFMTKIEPQLTPITQDYAVSPETVLNTMTTLKQRGISDEHLMDVTRETIAGAKASAIPENQIQAFAVAQMKRAAQENIDVGKIGAGEMRGLMLPGFNVGRGKLSGEQTLDIQQRIGAAGEAYGFDQNQMWAEVGVLSDKRGMDVEKAVGGLEAVVRKIDVVPEKIQKMEGIEGLMEEISKQKMNGNLVGAVSAIDRFMEQAKKEGRIDNAGEDEILNQWFEGRRGLTAAKMMMGSQREVAALVPRLGDETLYRERLAHATDKDNAYNMKVRAESQEKLATVESDKDLRRAENETMKQLAVAEAKKRNMTGYQIERLKQSMDIYATQPGGVGPGLEFLEGMGWTMGYNPIGGQKGFAASVENRYRALRPETRARDVAPTYIRPAPLSTEEYHAPLAESPYTTRIKELEHDIAHLKGDLARYREHVREQPGHGTGLTKGEQEYIKNQKEQITIAEEHLAETKDLAKTAKSKRGLNLNNGPNN
jgi:hypothetical protein